MRLTRRGYAAVALVALALAAALVSGPRSLNAVAGPLAVAVVAGAVQVARAGRPTVERTAPRPGFPGEDRTVELRVEGSGVARVEDRLSDGLSGEATVERSLPTTLTYDVTYDRRGTHEIGPATVRVRDVLGLVEAEYEVSGRTPVLVYPHVYSVGDPVATLRTLGPQTDERTEFDEIREYVPGDSLRDVNWKTSAKHDDLLVTEFTDPTDEGAVAVAASCGPGHADAMATAAATVVVAALRAGLAVELALPDGDLPSGYGESHRRHALEMLARTGSGDPPRDAWADADVQVRADDDGVTVTFDAVARDFDDLTASRDNPLLSEVPA